MVKEKEDENKLADVVVYLCGQAKTEEQKK